MSSKKRYEQPNVELVHFFFRYQDNRHYPLQQSFVAFVTKLRDFFSAFRGKKLLYMWFEQLLCWLDFKCFS